MAIVESVVEILLQKLADPLIREAIFLHGVDDQVKWLEEEFGRMKRFLKDAEAKQGDDERVKGWVGDVRDVAYDAEDVIDTFLFTVANSRRTGIKRYAFISNELKPRHKAGSKIEQINAKIRAVSESRSTYGIENIGKGAGTSSAGQSHQEWRLTSPNVPETDFVGSEKELDMLVARLTEGEQRRCVVSVVEMGGLGKTTLTKKLYNADTVKKHFHIHAWISVSQEYSARDLLQTITKRCMVLSKEELELVEKMNVIELREKISEYLKEKRYLVVLDDIWKMEAWDALKDAFPDMNNGSRVVLTTRNKDVALYADPDPRNRWISESWSTYGIENIDQGAGTSSAGQSHQEWRLTSPNVPEPDFVGFEKELDMLVARLTEGELRRCVVSVVGMGGLGKTTLTKELYNTVIVKSHFHTYAWISVSQEYSARDLLQVFVRRWRVVSDNTAEKLNITELRDKISEYLKHKRYLVVLDDIWRREAWNALKDAFPDVNNGSRVVLTTRNKGVASYADPRSQPHELRFLTHEESWDLFCRKTLILGRDGGCPQDLEKVGREIVEKCHGLPLAITVVGGFLSVKEPWEWENVCKSITWQLVKGEVQIISSILSLSYKDLPYELKPCFLYLGNFPEDYEFRANELIRLWAAEGFLKEREGLTLEEVGEDYLMQLVQRSMVQVARRSSSRRIKSCRIHNLLRDLSISEAKESMFLRVQGDNGNAPPASRARRLAIHLNDPRELKIKPAPSNSTRHLRSMLIYTQSYAWLQEEQREFLFQGSKLLRVLYLDGVEITELPKQIGELIHLRYLGCTKSKLETLPSSIGNLINLQTLFLQSNNDIEVPETIGKMHQLRHLQLGEYKTLSDLTPIFPYCGMIQGHPSLDLMSNLQTLSRVCAGKWMEGCLGKLTNLRNLKIFFKTGADAKLFYEAIVNLNCLHHLWVSTSLPRRGSEDRALVLSLPNLSQHLKLRKLYLRGKLETLPEFPTNLTKLTLEGSYLKEDPMATLEKLKNLCVLRLLALSYMGMEMACSAQGFPRLESLHLERLYLLEWKVNEGAMQSLLHLRIFACDRLKKLPEGLQHVTTLKKLELGRMPDESKARVRENVGEDWYKIQHIPSIVIHD